MGKYLILRDPQLCFLTDVIQTGLYEAGHDIYESPIVKSVRGGLDEKYRLPDGTTENSKTGCPGYLLPAPLPECAHTEEEIHDVLHSAQGFDLILMLSLREHSVSALNKFIPFVPDRKRLPIAAVDGEDYPWIDSGLIRELIQPKVFFKRELKKDHSLDDYSRELGIPVFPLPFAAFTRSYEGIDDQEKLWDLFLSMGYTHPARNTLVEKFLQFSHTSTMTNPEKCYIGFNSEAPAFRSPYGADIQPLKPWMEYMKHQARSKITAVMRGHGSDTMHQFESFSFATAVLYCPTDNYMPHPPRNMKECIFINEDCETVPRVLEHLLKENEFRQHLAQNGKAWCRNFHTTQKRAEYVVDVANGVLAGEDLSVIRERNGL
jgi:hypothetical protein